MRLAAAAGVFLTVSVSCSSPSTALRLDLRIADALFPVTARARILLRRADHQSFPVPDDPSTEINGVTVRNADVDGDGAVDIAVELGASYPFDRVNRFTLVPSNSSSAVPLEVRVEVFDSLGNLVAKLPADAAGRDFVTAVLDPGKVTIVEELAPACISTCDRATVVSQPGTSLLALSAPLTALAAGSLTGAPHSDLVVGSAVEIRALATPLPNTGHLRVWLGGPAFAPNGDVEVWGAAAGDLFGAALVIGDLDGDGKAELIVGAPGTGNGAGAVHVLRGASSWWTAPMIDLAVTPSASQRLLGQPGGARLGASLALADVDGDGRPEVLAGAPGADGGAGALYVLYDRDFVAGPVDGGAPTVAAVRGRAGSRLGTVLAARSRSVTVSAPLEAGGAVYAVDAASLQIPRAASELGRWLGSGGAFGSSLGLADLGDGLVVVAGSAGDGAGVISMRPFALPAGDTREVTHVVRASAPFSLFGVALSVVSRPGGDALVVGAPVRLPGTMGGAADGGVMAGSAVVLRAATIAGAPDLKLDGEGRPAAAVVLGSGDNDAFGSQLANGDFDQDGKPDLAIGAAGSRKVYVVRDLAF